MKPNHAINPQINYCLSSWNHAVNVILEGTSQFLIISAWHCCATLLSPMLVMLMLESWKTILLHSLNHYVVLGLREDLFIVAGLN
jgi:isoprenylcysteine carboxyl methyltransferase (ICMT) family protein YpbQ